MPNAFEEPSIRKDDDIMYETPFMQTVMQICARDERYRPDAYLFVRDALDFTVKTLQAKQPKRQQRHVSGQELLAGIRTFALQEYGPMARSVLRTWGVHNTRDFGNIVFNLVESGKLGKTEEDRPEDFADGFDFEDAFDAPFRPAGRAG